MVEVAEVREAYKHADRRTRVWESKIGCMVTLLLMPAGISLDYMIYPQHLQEFLLLRLGYDAFLSVMLALHFTELGQRHIRLITFTWLLAAQATIAYMIFATEGYQSTYYAGLNLALLAVGILLPTSVPEATAFSVSTVALYIASGYAHQGPSIESDIIYNNLYFLVLTAITCVTGVFLTSRRRFSEFRLSYELDERNKELAELDRLKSQFIANISHEFRTPLTLILAPIDDLLTRYSAFPGAIVDKLRIMRSNAARLLTLVNDLLEVIRLEEGGLKLERRPINVTSLLNSIYNAMRHLADSRAIAFHNELLAKPLWVAADQGALEKVFFNVLSNAFKFTSEGGGVTVSSTVEDGAFLVRFTDTGIGISSADLPYVFDRFRQADSSATRRYPGTGLGLALVKELTEQFEGQIMIDSSKGKGTQVTISLPLLADGAWPKGAEETEDVRQEALPSQWLRLAAETNAPALGARDEMAAVDGPQDDVATVLVVDDEPDMRHYLVDLLNSEYRVVVARDGQEGLDLTEQYRPELVVLDLMLPEIDGLEVCRRIKQNPELRASRVILLTARADEPSKLTALENGADDFLTKPFSGIEVQTRLRNLRNAAELEYDLHRRNKDLQDALSELRDTQNKLVHSEKLNALGRLSAGLLHEINNPLNYTLTALELAKTDPAVEQDEELKDTLDDIDNGMQRIRGIVSELRAFAYPSRGDQADFLLSEAIDSALHILAHEARGVTVRNEISADWTACGSRNHVTQVLVNLLSNAIKATQAVSGQRQGEIVLSAERREDRLHVTVRDNGPGIPPEALERVFDPFYTTREVGEGMGMGLSVCQTIIRNHDGELVARSEEGAWTEFTFDLTLKEPASRRGESEQASEALQDERTA